MSLTFQLEECSNTSKVTPFAIMTRLLWASSGYKASRCLLNYDIASEESPDLLRLRLGLGIVIQNRHLGQHDQGTLGQIYTSSEEGHLQ